MPLEDLNAKIHSRGFETKKVDVSMTEHTDIKPDAFGDADWTKEAAPTIVDLEEKFKKRRKWIMIGFATLGVLLLAALAFLVRAKIFDDARVMAVIDGPKSVAAAESITFSISYTNDNWVNLKNAELVLSYPEDFRPDANGNWKVSGREAILPLGEISSRSTSRSYISGKFFSAEGTVNYIDAKLQYEPSGVGSRLESTSRFGVNVLTSPLSLEVTAPIEAAKGNTVEYLIDYGNESDDEFSNVRVKADFPEGFTFVTSDPSPSEGNSIWYLGDLASKVGGKIRISGTISGNRDDVKRFGASIGHLQGDGTFLALTSRDRTTKIVSSPLSIAQTVNGVGENTSIDLGRELLYRVVYRNESAQGLRDAIVTVEFDTSILDFSRLRRENGYFNLAEKKLIWRASDIPELSVLDPGEMGEVTFSVPVYENVSPKAGTHLGIRTVARVDSPDIPTPSGSNKVIASDTVLVRLNSSIDFQVKGRYYDGPIWNTGPVPPEVGVQTTYDLTFRLSTSLNDLSDAKVVAALPSGVRFTGKISPDSESVTFNDRTNELIWNIGSYQAASEVAVREVTVQVAILPGPDEKDKEVRLMNRAVFSGKDTFVGTPVKIERDAKTTALPEDEKIPTSAYRVKK